MLTASGCAVIAAAVLIPARHGLEIVRHERDRVLAEERFRIDRLTRYESYLAALNSGDETLLVDLANREFGVLPAGTRALEAPGPGITDPGVARADPFGDLEPVATDLPERVEAPSSILGRWFVELGLSRWAIAAGAVLIFAGLLSGGSRPSTGGPADPAGGT